MIFKETEESEKIDIHNLKPKEIALFVCMSIFSFIGVFFTIFQIATSTGKSAFIMLLSALAISPLPYILIHNFEKKRTNAVTKIAVQVFISILLLFFSIMLTPDKNSQKEETTKPAAPDSTPQIIAEETTEETMEETKEETTEEATEQATEPPTETEPETIPDTTEKPSEIVTEPETVITEASTEPLTEKIIETGFKIDNEFISHHESEIVALATMTLDGFISDYKMSLAPQLWTIAVFDDSGAVMAITDITYNGIKGKYIYVGTINIKSNGSIESATPHYVSVAGYELGNDGYCNEFFENIS